MAGLRYAFRSVRRRAGSAAIPVADSSRLAFVSSIDPRPSQAQPDLVDWTARVPAYVLVVTVLSIAALAATYLPARRASRIDPVHALRVE